MLCLATKVYRYDVDTDTDVTKTVSGTEEPRGSPVLSLSLWHVHIYSYVVCMAGCFGGGFEGSQAAESIYQDAIQRFSEKLDNQQAPATGGAAQGLSPEARLAGRKARSYLYVHLATTLSCAYAKTAVPSLLFSLLTLHPSHSPALALVPFLSSSHSPALALVPFLSSSLLSLLALSISLSPSRPLSSPPLALHLSLRFRSRARSQPLFFVC